MTKKNIDNKSDFINHWIRNFFVLKQNISFSYILFSLFLIIDQILNASSINTQFIITCFNVCSSIPYEQFEWSNFDILRSCKNFVNSIFFVYICIIKLFFVFAKSTCHFIFFCQMILFAAMSIRKIVIDKSFNELFNHL